MAKERLPSLSRVKKFLFADWALRVKIRDGFKCLLCGETDNLSSHHWHVCDHHSRAARYCIGNGATLCYTCHIRGVHQRADHFMTSRVYRALRAQWLERFGADTLDQELANIERLAGVQVTTELLRSLWDRRRADVIELKECVGFKGRGGKSFLTSTPGVNQQAVIGNVVSFAGNVYEVTAATKVVLESDMFELAMPRVGEDKCWRYTLKLQSDDGSTKEIGLPQLQLARERLNADVLFAKRNVKG